MKYVVTNFVYGFGPFLRTTESALALNAELRKRCKEEFGIIVPLVYPGRQNRIMLEEFPEHADRIFLDLELGAVVRMLFYGDKSYSEALRLWAFQYEYANREARRHLGGKFRVRSLSGQTAQVDPKDIVLEINRAPRVSFDVSPSYSVTFGYQSEILRRALSLGQKTAAIDRELIEKVIPLAEEIERAQALIALAEPGTFSFQKDRPPLYPTEFMTPPTIYLPKLDQTNLESGIYVTITGLAWLERLYREARELGLKLYSNNPAAVPGSEKLSPHLLTNPAIKLQFARSGWGSVWLSQLVGTPLVVPDFDPKDDPEIYFNNRTVEELGLGVVYRGESLREIIDKTETLKPGIAQLNQSLLAKYGTLDGHQVAAKRFADHFLSR